MLLEFLLYSYTLPLWIENCVMTTLPFQCLLCWNLKACFSQWYMLGRLQHFLKSTASWCNWIHQSSHSANCDHNQLLETIVYTSFHFNNMYIVLACHMWSDYNLLHVYMWVDCNLPTVFCNTAPYFVFGFTLCKLRMSSFCSI